MSRTRIEILQQSLQKKEQLFDEKLGAYFNSARETNGQPLNDKSNGQSTLNRWERQDSSLRTLKESIEKTKNAIEKEELKISGVKAALEVTPPEIVELVEKGELNQWRKHPNTFFVPEVEKARIVWDSKKEQLFHRYVNTITDPVQWKKFAKMFNHLSKTLNN